MRRDALFVLGTGNSFNYVFLCIFTYFIYVFIILWKLQTNFQFGTLCWVYRMVLCCVVLYCIVLYCIVLYCIVLYCIVLYCIVLYCIVLYCTVLYQVGRDIPDQSTLPLWFNGAPMFWLMLVMFQFRRSVSSIVLALLRGCRRGRLVGGSKERESVGARQTTVQSTSCLLIDPWWLLSLDTWTAALLVECLVSLTILYRQPQIKCLWQPSYPCIRYPRGFELRDATGQS